MKALITITIPVETVSDDPQAFPNLEGEADTIRSSIVDWESMLSVRIDGRIGVEVSPTGKRIPDQVQD